MVAGGPRMAGVDGAEWHPAKFASVAGDPLDSGRAHARDPAPRRPSARASRPASNCGFTSTSARHGAASGGERRAEHERQRDERHVGHDEVGTVRQRRRGRDRGRWCARAPSRADRCAPARAAARSPRRGRSPRAAPRCSRQSVKPPVERRRRARARPRRPSRTRPARSRASPLPRETYGACSATSTAASSATRVPAFVTTTPSTRTCPPITRPCARPRVSTSPRATSTTSSRSLSSRPSDAAFAWRLQGTPCERDEIHADAPPEPRDLRPSQRSRA